MQMVEIVIRNEERVSSYNSNSKLQKLFWLRLKIMLRFGLRAISCNKSAIRLSGLKVLVGLLLRRSCWGRAEVQNRRNSSKSKNLTSKSHGIKFRPFELKRMRLPAKNLVMTAYSNQQSIHGILLRQLPPGAFSKTHLNALTKPY